MYTDLPDYAASSDSEVVASAHAPMETMPLTQPNLFQAARFVVKIATAIVIFATVVMTAAGQPSTASGQFPPYKAPRIAGGHPDLNGTWQALVTADWDLHSSKTGGRNNLAIDS